MSDNKNSNESAASNLKTYLSNTFSQSILEKYNHDLDNNLSSNLELRNKLSKNLELYICEEMNNFNKELDKYIKDNDENESLRKQATTDLSSLPVIGNIFIFLRGAQRPVWGFATLYFNYMVYSGKWDFIGNVDLMSQLYLVNGLVLGFLFGERAIKNVLPMISKFRKG